MTGPFTPPLAGIWALTGLALIVPDTYAGPIIILAISGILTFAVWLVKQVTTLTASNRDTAASLVQASKDMNAALSQFAQSLSGVTQSVLKVEERVQTLENWRLNLAESRRASGRGREDPA